MGNAEEDDWKGKGVVEERRGPFNGLSQFSRGSETFAAGTNYVRWRTSVGTGGIDNRAKGWGTGGNRKRRCTGMGRSPGQTEYREH